MTKKEAVMIAARVIAVYFFFWALDCLSFLPERFLSLAHYAHSGSVLLLWRDSYLFNLYLTEAALSALKAILLFMAGLWFYRNGAGVQRLLLGESDGDSHGA